MGYDDALTMFNQGRGAMVMCGSGNNALDGTINQGGIAIQKVFTSKGDLDLKGILDDAAAKVQKGSFDKVKIE